MKRIEFYEDYEAVVHKKSFTIEERVRILEYLRASQLFVPDIVAKHGSFLLATKATRSKLGEQLWAIYEQVCMASLYLGFTAWAAHCVEKLSEQFPNSKRVKRIYALYMESVQDWTAAINIYKEMLADNPEYTYARKRLVVIQRSAGKINDAIEAANKYLTTFQTDRDMWHELGEMYLQVGNLSKAAFCYEDLILSDPRNTYVILTYAELIYSIGIDFDLSRHYFCLVCDMHDTNPRALWGLFLAGCAKKKEPSDRTQQLMNLTATRLKKLYKANAKKSPSSSVMLAVLDDMLENFNTVNSVGNAAAGSAPAAVTA